MRPATSGRRMTDLLERSEPTAVNRRWIGPTWTGAVSTGTAMLAAAGLAAPSACGCAK